MEIFRSQIQLKYRYDEEMLTWEDIKSLDRHPLITIGSHTKSHSMLSLLTREEKMDELLGAKTEIESHVGHPVDHFAYPYGGRNEIGIREFQVASECGFTSSVTTRQGHVYQTHEEYMQVLPRISVNNDDGIERFTWKLCGIHKFFS